MPTLTLEEQDEYFLWSVVSDFSSLVRQQGLVASLNDLREHLDEGNRILVDDFITMIEYRNG